jgi:hypothetical protein
VPNWLRLIGLGFILGWCTALALVIFAVGH